MVAPIIEELVGLLEGRALNNWLRTGGSSLFRIFETGADALRYLQSQGLEVPSSTFYRIRQEVLDVSNSSTRLVNYDGDSLIPLNWHVKSHGLDLSTDYQYRIQLIGNDADTGLLKEEWMTVVSDRQLTKNEVQAMARAYLGEYGETGNTDRQIDDYNFGFIQALRR